MPLWTWRSTRRLLLLCLLLFTFAPPVQTQPSLATSPKWGQHQIRRNRVWSMRLSFELCGIIVTNARVARVSPKGDIQFWQNINPDLVILQWSQVLPFEPEVDETFYDLHDLLVDYAQTMYIVQIVGTNLDGTKLFNKLFWVTPAGISDGNIERPEVRKNRESVPWSAEDAENLAAWYEEHEWGSTIFSREFRALRHKSDKKIEIRVGIRGSDCEEEK